jgi:hypothetical protein
MEYEIVDDEQTHEMLGQGTRCYEAMTAFCFHVGTD